MGREIVPINTLTIDRDHGFAPIDDDLDALEASMAKGIRHPILVDDDYRVIDGLRQLMVLKKWGRTEVKVFRSSSLDFTLKILKRRHEDQFPDGVCREVTTRRIWQIRCALTEQIAQTLSVRQVESWQTRRGKAPPRPAGPPLRDRMAEALSGPYGRIVSPNIINRVQNVHRLYERSTGAEKEVVEAQIRRMDQDMDYSPYSAYHAVERWRDQQANIIRAGDLTQQVRVLENGAHMIGGLISALSPMTGHLDKGHDPDRLTEWAKVFSEAAEVFSQLSRTLRKKTEQ